MGGTMLVTPKIMILTIDHTRTETLWIRVFNALKKLLAKLLRYDNNTEIIVKKNAMRKPVTELRRVRLTALMYKPDGCDMANFKVE